MTDRPTHATRSGAQYLALQRLARTSGRPTAELFQLYALEGFLVRLAASEHRDRLVLKGGMLMAAFDARRPTRDIDLLALRTSGEAESVRALVIAIAAIGADDGLDFDLDTTRVATIREDNSYAGTRVTMQARLATARITFHVDVNVGDPVQPPTGLVSLPRLLTDEPVIVRGYPVEMVLAEKLITAVQRGDANTRWRDFADLHELIRTRAVDGAALESALDVVARFRGAPRLPLSVTLSDLPTRAQGQWTAWRRDQGLDARVPEDLASTIEEIANFADPALTGTVASSVWAPGASAWITGPPPGR